MTYDDFIYKKTQLSTQDGFKPVFMPDWMFDFQKYLTDWSLFQGRSADFADCGMGKTAIELVWSENVVRHTNKRVLLLTPLAVSHQTIKESEKFDIEAHRSYAGELYKGMVVTNYERLHHFNPNDFIGVVCDESSILKSYDGATKKLITRFMSKMPYRLLATATAAPNDWTELGTSSEALGFLSYSKMIDHFFKLLDDKRQKQETRKQNEAERIIGHDNNYYKKLAYRVSQNIGKYRLRHHSVIPFWRWVASWAKACRFPSDLGFSDDGFILPPLNQYNHVIEAKTPPPGMLFNMPAVGLSGEREERKRTLHERCEYVAKLVNHDKPASVWCQYNPEGDLLEKMIPDSRQVSGTTPDDEKCELYEAFSSGQLRVLITKPQIGAWGLNWQHCNHAVTFVSHSYEQLYQLTRRHWRFGQKNPVRLDIVATEGEARVLDNLNRKAAMADKMFTSMIAAMNNALHITEEISNTKTEVPSWLANNNK